MMLITIWDEYVKVFINVNERANLILNLVLKEYGELGVSSFSVKKCRNKFASEYITG